MILKMETLGGHETIKQCYNPTMYIIFLYRTIKNKRLRITYPFFIFIFYLHYYLVRK